MFENMAAPVGFAMHEDRLARAAKEMRLAEAKQGKQARKRATGNGQRAAVAKRLVTLAIRLSPSIGRARTA